MTKARPNRPDGGVTVIKSTKSLITPKPSVAGSDSIMSLAKYFGISHFLKNLLLRTSPRFVFPQSEPNQCRKILWRLNINNFQKKFNFRLTVTMGRQNFERGRATFSKMPTTPEQNEIFSPNSEHLCKCSS